MAVKANNLCSMRNMGDLNRRGVDLCLEGRRDFTEYLKPLVDTRHAIGAARLDADGGKRIAELKERFESEAKQVDGAIEGEYRKNTEKCEDFDLRACGYLAARDMYIETMGPVGSFGESRGEPTTLGMVPLHYGYAFVEDASVRNGEILFDTGMEYTAFSGRFLKDRFKEMNAIYAIGSQGIVAYENPGLELTIGGAVYHPDIIGAADVVDAFGAAKVGDDLNMIVGMDVLLRGPFAVDYDANKVMFDHDVEKLIEGPGWAWLPYEVVPSHVFYTIRVTVTADGKPLSLVLDTGANYTEIFESCLGERGAGEVEVERDVFTLDVYGEREKAMLEDEIDIGIAGMHYGAEVTIARNDVDFTDMPFTKVKCGVLGTNVLRTFNYVLDPDVQGIYLNFREGYEPPVAFEYGYIPEKTAEGWFVKKLVEGGAAENAGIEEGDMITAIDGRSTRAMSPLPFHEAHITDKDEIAMEVMRDGTPYCLTLTRGPNSEE